ncbi:hypothetical protein [Chitinophaga rhizophila]|uniref:Uncharacterized protein n=1 Tax=Chitinophaga rhizophila TaxID=2866212 RepID=A0ABS7G6L4_9BACT|nr:hypothetical protein [Chitinophaga rhizophila]MBW8683284.1 hypothetical protein [Chitinophaga rhizophila]
MNKLIAVFEELLMCKSTGEVDKLLERHNIDKKFHFPEKNYPKLTFKILPEEIITLKEKGILSEDNSLKDTTHFTTTEKLLYALVWKNGDLQKLKHIINGILADADNDIAEAVVFNQFGRYLSGRVHEPIIDQHVLRAFGVYMYRTDVLAVERYRRMTIVTKNEGDLIKRYKHWISNELDTSLMAQQEYNVHVDKILFGLGRYIKLKP